MSTAVIEQKMRDTIVVGLSPKFVSHGPTHHPLRFRKLS